MQTKHTIIIGDSRSMKELADKSVHVIITSPPYWQLKDYGSDDQIGFNDSYEKYINHLNLVWRECHRALHDGCRLCVNIGDQFARAVYYGRYKVIPIRTEIIKFCETVGFDYMGAVIWQKATTMHTTGGATIMGSFPYPRNGIVKLDYEFILLFKKPGQSPTVGREAKEKSKLTKDEWNEYFRGHWNFGGVKQEGHLAMFPEELPKRLIKMFSFAGDTVLDPFFGSGTTSLAAKNLCRNSVGYEINEEFLPLIKNKLGCEKTFNLDGCAYEFVRQGSGRTDFSKAIEALPYIFKDPHALDKKTDPKKLQFGSRVSREEQRQSQDVLLSVKEVLSPEIIKLSNDLPVRLLGVKQKREAGGKAVEYIREKTRGQKVFMRFDAVKRDEKNILLAYVYLQNKTFLNAHLIKEGLALPETEIDYKYKNKFTKLAHQAYA